MSNYPPGVTGSEFAIAGPDWEGQVDFECASDSVKTVPLFAVQNALDSIKGHLGHHDPVKALEWVGREIKWLEDILKNAVDDEGYCAYKGEADAEGYRGNQWWHCPACDNEHEQSGWED